MKKSSKPSMVSNMSKPTTQPITYIDNLVYGTDPVEKPNSPLQKPVTRIVFTNQLTPLVYKMLRQYEYWERKAIHEILDEALTSFFADKPEAQQELPEKERTKLLKKIQS
jgi:hypothetical protein